MRRLTYKRRAQMASKHRRTIFGAVKRRNWTQARIWLGFGVRKEK